MVISSLVVEAQPDKRESVAATLEQIEGVEIHGIDDNGKIVVTIEAETVDDSHDIANGFIVVDGVTGVNLIYVNFEDDPSLQKKQAALGLGVDGRSADGV